MSVKTIPMKAVLCAVAPLGEKSSFKIVFLRTVLYDYIFIFQVIQILMNILARLFVLAVIIPKKILKIRRGSIF